MENEENISSGIYKKSLIGHIAGWIIGVLLLIMALGVFKKSVAGAISILLGGLVLIPPLNTLIARKLSFTLSGRLRAIVAIVLFGIGISALPPIIKDATVPTVLEKSASDVTNQNVPVAKVETTQPVQNKETPAVSQPDFVFDVPSLLHKNIDEITTILGTPKNDAKMTALQMKSGSDKWDKEYEKDGRTLMVEYYVKTGMVIDFFVDADDAIYENRDKDKLFKLTNTNESDGRYSISFVPAMKDPTRFTGILITAK